MSPAISGDAASEAALLKAVARIGASAAAPFRVDRRCAGNETPR